MIKKIIPWFIFISLFLLIIIGFASKDKLNQYLSQTLLRNATPEIMDKGATYIDSAFNYEKNGLSYQITFLEFGAKGCSACKRMEKVMEEISEKNPQTVNVVFLNILKPESQILMKYFGIATIPTQVLLDKDGKVFFRHSGYFSAEDLQGQFSQKLK